MNTDAKDFFRTYSIACTTEADLYCHTGKELEAVLPRHIIAKFDKLDSEIKAFVTQNQKT